MRHILICLVLMGSLTGAGGAGAAVELITNGNAETGDLSGWSVTAGGVCNVSDIARSGAWSVTGGVSGTTGPWTNVMEQVVDLTPWAAAIDAGHAATSFTGWGRSNEADGAADLASLTVDWLNAGGGPTGAFGTGSISPYNQWLPFSDERTVPPGTRSVRIALRFVRQGGLSTDGFFDDLSLLLSVATGPCAADIDGDGNVNLSDIPLFAADYLAGTHPARSDINGDGLVDLSDIPLLAAAIGTTGCP